MASNERESPVKEKYRVCVANELKVQDGEVRNKSTASCCILRENNSNDVFSVHFVYLFIVGYGYYHTGAPTLYACACVPERGAA